MVQRDSEYVRNIFEKCCQMVKLLLTFAGSLLFLLSMFGWQYLLVLFLSHQVITVITWLNNRLDPLRAESLKYATTKANLTTEIF
jgi:hypothetical protein